MNPAAQQNGFKLQFSPDQISGLFPFHFAVDDDLKFLGAGAVLQRICPDIENGKLLTAVFETLRPTAGIALDSFYRKPEENYHHFFLFKHRSNQLQLRGGFVPMAAPGCHVFLGKPWLLDAEQLTVYGLDYRDFAIHDQTVDILQVYQASKAALEDAYSLYRKLSLKSSQLRLANEQLQASEFFARETLDSLKSAIVILDEKGVVISSNRAWTQVALAHGFTAEETAVGVNYLDDFMKRRQSPPTAALLAAGIREVISGKRADFTLEYPWHLPNQSQWFVCRASRFSGEGPVRVVVSNLDNTELKALQEQQNRSQRMESLGTLAGGIAHDLNNALAPIIMGGELLRVEYPQQSQMLDILQASAKRAAEMVRQLLTFAKGAEGIKTPLDARHLVKEMQNIIKSTFPKNIELRVELDQNLPMILGDATQLHQILLNLCVNARDAMPQGGRLTLEMKPVQVDEIYAAYQPDARPGRYLKLSVMDTGTGISPDDLNRIFEPFFTTKGPNIGTGLGLSTVLGIVKGHGGFIRVYSEQGKGSTFAVHLPVEQAGDNTARMFRPAAGFRGEGETILLVDDEGPIRHIGSAVLTKLGFKPLTASDGMEGLLLATEHRTHLSAVITDVEMPHMSGMTMVQALRRLRPDLPIAAMSGRFSEATQAELLKAGVTVQLHKPFTETQLAEVMRQLLAPQPTPP